MYIYLDKKGVVKEIINDEALRQGNSNANTCYVYYEDYENVKSMLVSYELQDHTITQEAEVATSTTKGTIPYDAERDLKYFRDDGTIYDFFVFTIADEPLSQDGIFRMTIRFVSSDGTKISTMGLLCFNVEAEVVQSDSGITLSQYNYLVEQWFQNKEALPIPSDLLVDNGKLYLTTAGGQAMGSGAELPKKYRHTIVISSSNGIISMTTESSKNTVVDSVQDLISVFANTTLSACGAVQYEGGRAISIYLQVGNSISNTNIAYAPVESGTGASIELFTSIFGTSGFTITDNVTPV